MYAGTLCHSSEQRLAEKAFAAQVLSGTVEFPFDPAPQ